MAERLIDVWRTSAQTLRLSGVAGAPLRTPPAAVLGLIALLCVPTVVGVIATGPGDRPAELRRGDSTVLEHGHAVVLGRSDQVFTVAAELSAASSCRAFPCFAYNFSTQPCRPGLLSSHLLTALA
ncbi:hypothetical protein ACWD3I_46135 [Streptomyces sp. NPDC002817]|uniref:hypothetical protein n=1 Tax=Streptomyces sp. NPDC088357 TaxID=3154655 RepID=UPI00342F5649